MSHSTEKGVVLCRRLSGSERTQDVSGETTHLECRERVDDVAVPESGSQHERRRSKHVHLSPVPRASHQRTALSPRTQQRLHVVSGTGTQPVDGGNVACLDRREQLVCQSSAVHVLILHVWPSSASVRHRRSGPSAGSQ